MNNEKPYQPSKEELNKAEGMMSDSEKLTSQTREENFKEMERRNELHQGQEIINHYPYKIVKLDSLLNKFGQFEDLGNAWVNINLSVGIRREDGSRSNPVNISLNDWGSKIREALRDIGEQNLFITNLGYWEENVEEGGGAYKDLTQSIYEELGEDRPSPLGDSNEFVENPEG